MDDAIPEATVALQLPETDKWPAFLEALANLLQDSARCEELTGQPFGQQPTWRSLALLLAIALETADIDPPSSA